MTKMHLLIGLGDLVCPSSSMKWQWLHYSPCRWTSCSTNLRVRSQTILWPQIQQKILPLWQISTFVNVIIGLLVLSIILFVMFSWGNSIKMMIKTADTDKWLGQFWTIWSWNHSEPSQWSKRMVTILTKATICYCHLSACPSTFSIMH
jgi:hypothetical protein